MVKCEDCHKEINQYASFVRLDGDATKRLHVKCYLKRIFPDAKEGEIKVSEVTV